MDTGDLFIDIFILVSLFYLLKRIFYCAWDLKIIFVELSVYNLLIKRLAN